LGRQRRLEVSAKSGIKTRVQKKSQTETDLGFSWGLTNTLLLAGGVAALVIGYLALSRGSITVAPVLLVLGYCVLIPSALLIRRRDPAAGE
jgi:Flp pilus assembly protein TadB